MSKSRQTDHPLIPRVSAETWKALVGAADEFNQLAPWKWMHDSHVVGLRHPITREVLLGSVLGRLRTMFALLVYRRDTGHRWLLNTILNDGDSGGFDHEEGAFEQDLVQVDFVLKRDLAKEDRGVLATARHSQNTRRGHIWPKFRSVVPGGYPWHLTQGEAETLLFALPRVAAVARLLRARPRVWDDHCDGDIGFVPDDFDPASGELQSEQMDWRPMIPPPEPFPEKSSLDDVTVARLLKLKQAKGFHLELDVAYSGFAVADLERPCFPKVVMAVDRASGFVGGFVLVEFKDRDGARALGQVLQDALTQMEHRPESIRVQRPRVQAMLSGLAKELGIPVIQDEALDELNFARQSMEQHFNGAR